MLGIMSFVCMKFEADQTDLVSLAKIVEIGVDGSSEVTKCVDLL